MRYLGLDLGTKTLGLAISDKTGTIATSLKTIRFEENDYDVLYSQIKEIVDTEKVVGLVLGLPKNMNNSFGFRAEETIAFQKKLEEYLSMDVILQDERLSTVAATNYMLEADISRKKRKKKVDSLAASIILQTYLDTKKG